MRTLGHRQGLPASLSHKGRRPHVRHPDLDRPQPLLAQPLAVRSDLVSGQQFLRVVNGEYGFGELKAYHLVTYVTGIQLLRPEASHADVRYPTDEDYKHAVEMLRETLQRWAALWTAHPPCRINWDMSVYLEENAKDLREFKKMVSELPKETVLTLFVPGFSQVSTIAPPPPGRSVRRRIKNLLPGGQRAAQFVILEDYVGDVLAAMQFDDPVGMCKAIAVGLFRTLLNSGIPLARCRRPECNRYFLDLSGVSKFCSRKHAQAAVNQRRKEKRIPPFLRFLQLSRSTSARLQVNKTGKRLSPDVHTSAAIG